jgi:hypothetical protein
MGFSFTFVIVIDKVCSSNRPPLSDTRTATSYVLSLLASVGAS